MSQTITSSAVVIYGTRAEVLADTSPTVAAGSLFRVDDGVGLGEEYSVSATTGLWFLSSGVPVMSHKADGTPNLDSAGNPAVTITESPVTLIKYSDATYEYYCEAPVGTARATALWRVFRKTIATSDIVYAGTGLNEHAGTSLAVVSALTYTLA